MVTKGSNDQMNKGVLEPLIPSQENDSGDESDGTTKVFFTDETKPASKDVLSRANCRHWTWDACCSLPVVGKRKKAVIALIAVVVVLMYVNASWETTDKIPVIHHSHVPGMKELKSYAATQTKTIITNAISNKKLDKDMRSVRKETVPLAAQKARVTTPKMAVDDGPRTTRKSKSHASAFVNASTTANKILPPSGYLVWSDKCKIRDIDPYSPDVMKYFKREKYETCSNEKPLTSVRFNSTSGKYALVMDQSLVEHYSKSEKLDCCYQAIERNQKGAKADAHVTLTVCLGFTKPSINIPPTTDNIMVRCKTKKGNAYTNGHPMMPERDKIRERLKAWKRNSTTRAVSVLMLGIDSISRTNLIRAMPKTAQYLYDNEWFEMSGYNKMADNTFPNLMAILTGYNSSTAFGACNPRKVGMLDACPFIWKTFREHGYVTAYAEDQAQISTFNYLKVGFEKPPVDYYLRPFLLEAEHSLHIKRKSGMNFCLGFQHSADYIYDYALELATRYKNESYFGLFWANTFSHQAISDPSSMDVKIGEYLKKLADRGILDESIVIFFSDHGMRFGPTRKLVPSGYLEERLPFMFIWLPPWLKESHPEFVDALSVNKNRLTNPYDIHMTLKHILELSGRVSNLPHAEDCPNCQTLLRPVPHSRSCQEIGIEDHWCTCTPYESISKNSDMVKKIAKKIVDHVNEYVQAFNNGSVAYLCAKLHLSSVQSSSRAIRINDDHKQDFDTYLLTFSTKPNDALFEATVRYYNKTAKMSVTGEVSRLNIYAHDSRCIADGGAKKYCSCLPNVKPHSNGPTHMSART